MNRKPGSRSRRNLGMTSRQLGMLVILAVLLLLVVSVTLVFALDLFDVSLAPVLPTEPSTRSAGELEGTPSPGDQTSLPPSSTLSFQVRPARPAFPLRDQQHCCLAAAERQRRDAHNHAH